jgi:hypothetical protein
MMMGFGIAQRRKMWGNMKNEHNVEEVRIVMSAL